MAIKKPKTNTRTIPAAWLSTQANLVTVIQNYLQTQNKAKHRYGATVPSAAPYPNNGFPAITPDHNLSM